MREIEMGKNVVNGKSGLKKKNYFLFFYFILYFLFCQQKKGAAHYFHFCLTETLFWVGVKIGKDQPTNLNNIYI